MVVNFFSRAFDLLFGLRKGEPMFRRLVPLWVIVSTIVRLEGRRAPRCPSRVDLVPTRTALERLGLERQWFGVIPLVETERLMKITLAGDLLFAQTDYAIVHAFDAESGRLLWSAQLGERTGFARGVTANSFAVYRDQRQLSCTRSTGRPADRSGSTTWARSRRARRPATRICVMVGMTSGKVIDVSASRVTDANGNKTILITPSRRVDLAHGRPDSHATVAGRRVRGLRLHGRQDRSWSSRPMALRSIRITTRRTDRRGTRERRDSASADPLGR